MRRIRYSLLSVLLALSLVLPMCPAARAAVSASSVTLSSSANTLYYRRDGSSSPVAITAGPSDFIGSIQWSVSGDVSMLAASSMFGRTSAFSNSTRSVLLSPASYASLGSGRSGTVTVTATVWDVTGASASRSVLVTIREESSSYYSLDLSQSTLRPGASARATLRMNYANGTSTVVTSRASFTSSNTSVARVDSNGVITAVSNGSAVITAVIDGESLTARLTVSGNEYSSASDVTDTANLGDKLYLRKIYNEINARYVANYSVGGSPIYPSETASVVFSTPSSSESFGLLRDSADRIVENGDSYYFSDMDKMYLESFAEGTYTFTCTVTDGSRSFRANVSIRITAPVRTIRISVSSASDYRFSSADSSGKTGQALIREALGSFTSIRFGRISSGENVGTLYANSPSSANLVSSQTVIQADEVANLYFVPSRSGTYRVSYEAYNNTEARGNPSGSGELSIVVDGSSLELSVELDSTDPYTFSNTPRSGASSAATLINNAIRDAIGSSSWRYIRLTPPTESNPVGTLHETSGTRREIAASDYIYSGDLGKVYFVPSRTGTYLLGYGAYADNISTSPLTTGTIRLVVSNVPTSSADIAYTVDVGGELKIRAEDFEAFYQSKQSSRYYLSCVVFDAYNGGGTFLHDGVSFIPYNSPDYYSRTYTGKLSANPRYLDKLSFKAPAESGYTAVKFTCYGGTSSDSNTVRQSGVLYIFYTKSDVPAVSYEAYGGNSVSFREADFAAAYQKATNSALASPKFSIRLLTVPKAGQLRQTGAAGRLGSAISSSDLGRYNYTVGGGTSYSVDNLIYTPLNGTSSSDTMIYVAYDNDGKQLYAGTVRVKLKEDRVVSVSSVGYSFQINDFYSATDANPVQSVSFRKPASGKLFVDLGSSWKSVDDSQRFTVGNSSGSDYSVTSLHFFPKSGSTEAVTLEYTAHYSNGTSGEGSMQFKPASRTTSTVFRDVTGWATDSVDFANTYRLVGGMGDKRFAPSENMRRCDMVLILYRLAGQPATGGTVSFSDVPANAYYVNAARWAGQKGIMEGVTVNNQFNPQGSVTRQDFAQMLYNFAKATGGDTSKTASLSGYSDAGSVSSTTVIGVSWAVANKLITSTSAGKTLEPARSATRAELVTLLHRYLTFA